MTGNLKPKIAIRKSHSRKKNGVVFVWLVVISLVSAGAVSGQTTYSYVAYGSVQENPVWDWYRLSIEDANSISIQATSNASNYSFIVAISAGVQAPDRISSTPLLAADTLNLTHQLAQLVYKPDREYDYLYLLVISMLDEHSTPVNYTVLASVPMEKYSYASYKADVIDPQTRPLLIVVMFLVVGVAAFFTGYMIKRRIREKRLRQPQ